ncbi:glutamate--tRNA ligase family protein [Lewinella sp. 4G2]|uniref:glutamate--tRNA ligase family protein n=1 Tax=Lewinella sp. 4G2 TaxID=1803372 RepID=UPI0007B4E051|nr:glutamate--tRNA ligase family protein [Lewinella sp. 4G2]OAV46074.1 hypothetical protein A3850_017575 [Lewinella sp. 4G2]
MKPKSRIAPTPSGYLHEGNLANFLLNAALVRDGGELMLRVDDLDRARYRRAYVEDIFRCLNQLGIQRTEGPVDVASFEEEWSQEKRLPQYRTALDRLRESDLVFACPCSRKELQNGTHVHGCLDRKIDLDTRDVAWRVDTRQVSEELLIPDLVQKEPFVVEPHTVIPDFVIRNKAGRPAYQLACTVDDRLFGINTVGRGQDLLPSTAAQMILSDLLGFDALMSRITFLHHPLITAVDGSKLSKSAGARSEPLRIDGSIIQRLEGLTKQWLG